MHLYCLGLFCLPTLGGIIRILATWATGGHVGSMEAIIWFTASLLSIIMPIAVVILTQGRGRDKFEDPSLVAATLAFFSGIILGMTLALFWEFIYTYGGVQSDGFA